MIKDYKNFLSIIKDLKLYLVGFEKNRLIKTKKYLNNYAIKGDKCYFIIYNTIII